MVEAVVEYDYDAVNPDELNLKEGEIITNINMLEEGWWEGELNGKRGMFPDNFVKVLKGDPTNKRNSKSKAPGPPVNGDAAGLHISQEAEVVKRESSAAKRKFRAKVAFSYHPENEDELNLEVDDIIEVTGQPEDGWWEGTVRGNKGVFPSNFVTLLEDDENMDVANGKVEKPETPPETEAKEPPPAKPSRPMSTRKGSVDLKVPEPKDDPPREEEPPAQKQKPLKPVGGVGFGNIFAGGGVQLRKTNQDQGKGPKKSEPPKRPELSNLAQKRQSLKKPVADDAIKREKKELIKEKKEEKKEEPKEEMATEEEIVLEKAKVNFDYEAQNPDELSLTEGDIIVITSKEAGDSGWWEGELNGKRGVFPDNFVTLLAPEKIKRKIPAPVPARPTAAPKVNEEHKPVTANKPRRGSKEPPPKPPTAENEAPKDQPIKEETKPHAPPGGKQVFPIVPPKKPNFKKLPPKPQDKDVPKRPSSFIDKDKDKPVEKETPVEPKEEKEDGSFDDIKPNSEKLKHVNLSRPRNAKTRPPSVFGTVPGVTLNDQASKHVPTASSPSTDQQEQPPAKNVLHKFTPTHADYSSSTNTNPPSPSSQPPWAKDLIRTSGRRPTPLVLSSEQPLENDISSSTSSGPPPRPATTPSPVSTTAASAPVSSSNKPEASPAASPGNDQPDSGTAESNASSAALMEAMEDMKKQMKNMQEDMNKQLASMKTEFKKELKKLMVEVDEEKKLRLSMQVELERIKKLVLDS